MSYNGSGLFQINTSGQPVVAGTVITASAFNALTADLATGLTTAITKDGQTATTAQIPFAQGLRSTLVTDSTTSTSGSIITDGGLGVAKAANIGTTLGVTGAITGSSTITGTKLIPTGTSVTGNGMYLPATNTLGFSTNGTLAAVIDANQNVGVGVTPSAWYSTSTAKALQIPSGALSSDNANDLYLTQNAYLNSGATSWVRNAATAASQYLQNGGAHQWLTTGSSTAGSNITWTQAMTLDASNNLAVTSVANPGYGIYVNRNLASTYALGLQNSTNNTGNNFVVFINYLGNTAGAISQNAIATVNYGTASDYRLKENITPMEGALNKVAQLKPVTYKWKDSGEESQGFIAHELQSVLPDCVVGEKDATKQEQYEIAPAVKDEQGNIITPAEMGSRTVPVYQMVDTSFLVATLTAAIQEQQALITQLQADVAALKG
jgi:hypothetical protein